MDIWNVRLEHASARQAQVSIVESQTPSISWALSAGAMEQQAAVRLTVDNLSTRLWDSGWIATASQKVEYQGASLTPGDINTLSITVRDGGGHESTTVQQQFCLGSLESWPAKWIGETDPGEDTVIRFVRDFTVHDVVSACLFVSGLGYHKVSLNGQEVFAEPLNPAWSEYQTRCYYTVLPDLGPVLADGLNRLAVTVASGWRSPASPNYELVNRWPDYLGPTVLSAALRIRYADGREEWVYTDEEWATTHGPITYSNLFIGEFFDANHIVDGWSEPGVQLSEAGSAQLVDAPGGRMVPQTLEAVSAHETYPALTVSEVAPGVYGVDFGQNIAGVCRLRIPSAVEHGRVIELAHAEILDEKGRLYRETLRNATSIDRYTSAGEGQDPEYWQPEFTYHGFRYVEVSGFPGRLRREDITAVALRTAVDVIGDFRCGNALVNQIQKNAVQTEKANIHSVLTDCPQRDERMAWLNDSTVRFEETPYNFDIGRLFPKVVRDAADVQDEHGSVTCTAPFAFGARPADPVCSAHLIAGWQAFMHTGNQEILAEGYEGFRRWNQFLASRSEGGIVQYSYYGDWAAPAYACIDEENAVSAVTPGVLMSTGYHYYNARLLAQMARVLGRPDEAEAQEAEARVIREAFLAKWWNEATGTVATGSQGCQAFALWLGILPESGRQLAADVLRRDLIDREYRFTTGNLCTRYMLDVLTQYGYVDDAWALVTREEYPSLGYMIGQEATTVWERFELKKNPVMNSHNHPMYGALSYWFYAYLAGVKPLESGWSRVSIRPYFPLRLPSVQASVRTPYGDIAVRWVKRYGQGHLYVTLPHGVEADITTPDGTTVGVGAGFHRRTWDLPSDDPEAMEKGIEIV